VKDAMSNYVITISPEMFASEAAEIMKTNGIRGLPVTNRQNELVGIITVTDILGIHPDYRNKKTVSSAMTKDPVVTVPTETLSSVLGKLTGNQIGRLPVVSAADKKKLVGIVTREDIWRVYRIEINSRLEEST
jgi:CBS domain-containing protein